MGLSMCSSDGFCIFNNKIPRMIFLLPYYNLNSIFLTELFRISQSSIFKSTTCRKPLCTNSKFCLVLICLASSKKKKEIIVFDSYLQTFNFILCLSFFNIFLLHFGQIGGCLFLLINSGTTILDTLSSLCQLQKKL